MQIKICKNECGDISFFTIFIILAVNMVMAFLLLFASIRIECINIRNAAKMELNNISARIYADTFHSQREANLDSYMEDLNLSSDYQEALRSDFIQGLANRIPIENNDYSLSDIRLDFRQYGEKNGKIEYIFYCNAEFRIQMFGEFFPSISLPITLTGSHNTKYS